MRIAKVLILVVVLMVTMMSMPSAMSVQLAQADSLSGVVMVAGGGHGGGHGGISPLACDLGDPADPCKE